MASLKVSPIDAELCDVPPDRGEDAADSRQNAEHVDVSYTDGAFAEPEFYFPKSDPASRRAGQFEHYFPVETLFASYDQQEQERDLERRRPSDPFAVLGLSREASVEEIRAAHKKLVKRYHPDRFQNRSAEEQSRAEERMAVINASYSEVLSIRDVEGVNRSA